MSDLRQEIREILREEIASLRERINSFRTEFVAIESSSDLNSFAVELVRKSESPSFRSAVQEGSIKFELSRNPHNSLAPSDAMRQHVAHQIPKPQPAIAHLDKQFITERDIAALDQNQKLLRVSAQTRFTPLAQDEARRRGVKIERCSS